MFTKIVEINHGKEKPIKKGHHKNTLLKLFGETFYYTTLGKPSMNQTEIICRTSTRLFFIRSVKSVCRALPDIYGGVITDALVCR